MGAIGASLIARDLMKNSGESNFKGFTLMEKSYSISSFECKGCPNYCEINRVKLADEDKYLFYGGRCEKYEKDSKTSKLPDPLKIREELLWKAHREYEEKYKHRKAPVIGIPHIFLFSRPSSFLEQSSLGNGI